MNSSAVSFIVPVFNGRPWIAEVIESISREAHDIRHEIIVVDDGSTDGSREFLDPLARAGRISLLHGSRRGAAAAINLGLRVAEHPTICQVDQDVVIRPGWLCALTGVLQDQTVAAAQGVYAVPANPSVWQRVADLDLRQRYRRVGEGSVNHVCTGNTAYRRAALRSIGGFREHLGYGYDNDVSYRLTNAGYHLAVCHDARAVHYWPRSLTSYFQAQYGLGYGRLDLIREHPSRLCGDQISRLGMMLHAPAALASAVALTLAAGLWPLDGAWRPALGMSLGIIAVLTLDRSIAGIRAAREFGDAAGAFFAPVHLLRDLAWACALVVWGIRRLARRPAVASHSMSRRTAPGRSASA